MANNYVGMKCVKGCTIEVLHSGAGYYLGTLDEEGLPNCRISTNYVKSREEDGKLFPDRNSMENMYCCNGVGCLNVRAVQE